MARQTTQSSQSPTKKATLSSQSLQKNPTKPVTDTAGSKSGHLKKEDYLTIINWLNIKKNYDACFGCEKATTVGRPPKTKLNGYLLMAIHLKTRTKDRIDLTSKQMAERFKNYRAKYRKAHMLEQSTGFGLSEMDLAQGIKSNSEKLDLICPYYTKMDLLFGQHANITPLYQNDAQDSSSDESSNNRYKSDQQPSASEKDLSFRTEPTGYDPSVGPSPIINDTQEDFIPQQTAPLSHLSKDEALPEIDTSVIPLPRPYKKCKNKRRSRAYQELTAEERALDESSELESDGSSPPTKKKKKESVSENSSPQKRRVPSNASNINPKSHCKGGSTSSSPFVHYNDFIEKRDSEKNQVARERLDFERLQFNLNLRKEDKKLDLEEKKYYNGILLEEKKLDLEKEEKEKDRQFQRERFDMESNREKEKFEKEKQLKKQEFIMECVKSGKTTEEITTLVNLMF